MEDTVPPIAAFALPTEEDLLPVLNAKLSSYLYVLHLNHCIAPATRSTFSTMHKTPEAQAKRQVTHHEQEYFQAWKNGTLKPLPQINLGYRSWVDSNIQTLREESSKARRGA